MAAIDKLYLKSYEDLCSLRLWAMCYYPKLLLYFYEFALTADRESFERQKRRSAKAAERSVKNYWEKISSDGSPNSAIAYYKEECSMDERTATFQAKCAYDDFRTSLEDRIENATIAVMNTPFKIDKKLKWICPLDCIRFYLRTQCGVKERWYYKLFWRGKQHFKYY